ncbi:MAG: DNA-directed RNA polymerase subunit alpha [Candidatus Pacebacteria bacterium]|nr:DNA-directed RNA polymerase subunit alpha [Candidatus Paceibacterota bacterium]
MFHQNIVLPKKLNVIEETPTRGIYEIEGLYPGYGHTLGNALRRIILSSLPGVSITSLRIKGADHEFATLDGIKEDVLTIILNLKKVRFSMASETETNLKLSVKGPGIVTASLFDKVGGVEVTTPDQYIAEITDKKTDLDIEITLAKGIGFVSKEDFLMEKPPVGTILVDAIFSPIRKVNYEVEHMRVGDRTDYNLLRINLETDGSISAKEALEDSLKIIIKQIKSILDMKTEEELDPVEKPEENIVRVHANHEEDAEGDAEVENFDPEERVELLKTRIDTLDFSSRTERALGEASIRTLGGLVQKSAEDLLDLPGFGQKSLEEVEETLSTFKLKLKEDK